MLQRKTELDKTITHWTIPTLIEKDRFLDQVWHQKAKTMSISLVKMVLMDRNTTEHIVREKMIVESKYSIRKLSMLI